MSRILNSYQSLIVPAAIEQAARTARQNLTALVLFAIAVLSCAGTAYGDTTYYRHTFFDNSITRDAYFYSHGRPSAPSTLELVDEKLPVDLEHFYAPPNTLRLNWQSAAGGGWDAEINVVNFRNREINFPGDTLYMWCFATQQIAAKDLPLIRVLDTDKNSAGAFFLCIHRNSGAASLEKHRVQSRRRRWRVAHSRY